jgi:hypothetical protein
MEEGFPLGVDAEGKPTFGWLGGLEVFARVQRPITAFRCISCGDLEFYAN